MLFILSGLYFLLCLHIHTFTFLSKIFPDPWCTADDASYRPEFDCCMGDSSGSWVHPATS